MTGALAIDHYDWAGGREAFLRFGTAATASVIVAPALFEEANRTRALVVQTLRLLAARGIAGGMPDLPGQGESEKDLAGVQLAHWRCAFAAAAATLRPPRFVLAVRGGSLLDGDADVTARLHLTPIAGRTLVRDLLRARRVASLARGATPPADDIDRPGPPLRLAGNVIDRSLLRDLVDAEPVRADRTITLLPDPAPSDRTLSPTGLVGDGADRLRFRAPWGASEPFADPALAAALADEVARWIACAA